MWRRAFLRAIWLLAIAALPAAISGAIQLTWRQEEPLAKDEVTPETARSWGSGALFVDARPRARFEAGHIPGAILLNAEEWNTLAPKFLDQWQPEQTVVVYCDGGSCEVSREVANRVRDEFQIPKVYVLKGGWPAWQQLR